MSKTKKIINLLLVSAGFAILYYFNQKIVLLYISFGLLLAGILSEKLLDCILKAWTAIGRVLGYINTRVILFILFYFIITPYSLVMRIFKGGSMDLTPDRSSMLKVVEKKYSPEDLANMW